MSTWRALQALSHAVLRAEAGDAPGTLRALDSAAALEPTSAWVFVQSSRVRHVVRDYDGEIRDLGAAARCAAPRTLPKVLRKMGRSCARLWRFEDAQSAALLEIDLRPRDATLRLELASMLTARRDFERALEQIEAACAVRPGDARIKLEAAGLASTLDDDARAMTHIRGAIAADLAGESAELETAWRLLDAGAVGEAIALSERMVDRGGSAATLAAAAALAVWRGEPEVGRPLAQSALHLDPHLCAAARALAAAALVQGENDQARDHALAATALGPDDSEAHLTLAAATLAAGDPARALAIVDRGITLEQGFSPGARILRLLVSIASGHQPDRLSGNVLGEVQRSLAAMDKSAPRPGEAAPSSEIRHRLETSLARLSGNFGPLATFLPESGGDRRLARLRVRSSPRYSSRRALELVRILPAPAVLARFDAVLADFPESPLPICHRGELFLWLGDGARAKADFEAALAIDRETRFAWVGLSAVALLEGRPAEALDIAARGVAEMHDTEGPALLVYRGAAHRALGHFGPAAADLERACEISPGRLGAWVELGVVRGLAEGDHRAREALAILRSRAPVLVADASHGGMDDPLALLQRMLVMMRGNRSSTCVTYFTRDGSLRAVAPHTDGERHLHRDDARSLESVRREIESARRRTAETARLGR